MTILEIKIENVKGIQSLKVNDRILKNRPNILVACNGFGKTSIATLSTENIESKEEAQAWVSSI